MDYDGYELAGVGVMDAGPTVSVALGNLQESLVTLATLLDRLSLNFV